MIIDDTTTQELQTALRGNVIRRDGDGYDEARRIFNAMIDRRPQLIARCAGAADVMQAVGFARAHSLEIAVRAGGHNVTGNALVDDGIVVDLSAMKSLRLDPQARTYRADAGLTWGDVNHDLQPFGLAGVGGFVSTTGVAGLTLGGGLGWLVRKYGLACDNLLSADIVTADGRFLTADPEHHQDLFWALRGGGGNFGVVTSFEFRAQPVGTALAGLVIHPVDRARDFMRYWLEFTKEAPEELTDGLVLLKAPPAPFVPPEAHGAPVIALYAVYAGDVAVGEQVLKPLREYGPPLVDIIQPMPYSAAQMMADNVWPPGLQNYWKSSLLPGLADACDVILDSFATMPSPMSTIIIEHNGGAMNRVPAQDTAFIHRDMSYNILITSLWSNPADADANITWTRELWDAVQPFAGAVYVNYLGGEGQDRVREAYGANFDRLVEVKGEYDPDNVFHMNQNIVPMSAAAV